MSRALLIVNPAARGGRSAEAEALTTFGEIGVAVDVRRTTRAGDAARFAAEHSGNAPVFTLGGDGTPQATHTYWKGFKRGTAVGLVLEHRRPGE